MCGMTRESDVVLAADLGVSAVGFVLWPKSPRAIPMTRLAALVRAVPTTMTPIGVFVSPSDDDLKRAIGAGIRIVQLHGAVDAGVAMPTGRWIARSLDSDVADVPRDVTILLDAHDPHRHGGTGRTIDWNRAAAIAAERRVILAGGLTAGNVEEAIRHVRPYGVDVASGIEDRPGVKNAQAMTAFVAAVREADQ